MSDLYYVRIRGSVVGPFRLEQVRQLIERGKVSRLHELSTDRQTWRPLREFPELAVAPAPSASASASGLSPPSSDDAIPAPQDNQPPPPVTKQLWHYDDGGQPAGPVDEAAIAALLASGRITRTSLVWTRGMTSWQPIENTALAWLLPGQANGSPGDSGETISGPDGARLPRTLIEAATSIAPWAWLLCLESFLIYGVMVIAQVLGIFYSARAMQRVVHFLMLLFFLGMLGACGFLFQHARQLTALRYTRERAHLVGALKLLRLYWLVSAVTMMVVFAILTIGLLLVVAAGVDIVNAFR